MYDMLVNLVIAIIPSLLISIVTAKLTVRWSLRQFHSQKWWEKQAETYSHIMEQLSHLQYCLGRLLYDLGSVATGLTEDRRDQIHVDYHKARESVEIAAATGSFMVSVETAEALRTLVGELGTADMCSNIYNDFKMENAAVAKCMAEVRDHAKADLQISWGKQPSGFKRRLAKVWKRA